MDDSELLRQAIDLAPAGILAVDAQGRILLVNREVERLFGYDRQELLGEVVDKLVPVRFRAEHPGYRARYHSMPEARRMGTGRDLYGVRRDGTEVPIEIGLNPARIQGKPAVLATIVDITTRRELESQLRQSHKMEAIGTLAGGVAHDFNNILLGIMGHAELARREVAEGSQVHADLGIILQASERGRMVVERILAFSRKHNIERAPLDPVKTVRESLELVRASLPTTIEIRSDLHAETPVVFSHEGLLHQVVINLVTNAAHAMPDGGMLEVGLRPHREPEPPAGASMRATSPPPGFYARLTVRDNGAGIAEEVRERLFEPFFTTKPPGRGTGLGLSVIHGIVQEHEGAITVDSEPGRGTRMDVYLPAHGQRVAAVDAEPARGPRVLLVEDEVPLARMLGRQLRALGLQPDIYNSSEQALASFESDPERFDLLITDNTMPRMTGMELARRTRALRGDLPILLISGLAATADPDDLNRAGIDAVLGKPSTMDELSQALQQLLGERLRGR